MKSLLLRPSVWVGLVAIVVYCDPSSLRGEFVYDDAGSVKRNVVVTGRVPFTDVFRRDFWGTPMKDATSHKSFRPITTMSFWLNWKLSEHFRTVHTNWHTLGFHVMNVLLHGIVSALVVEVAALVFGSSESSSSASVVTGLLFAVHPVHAEAVSNVTSRGELLMSLFYLSAILSYFHQYGKNDRSAAKRVVRFLRVYGAPVVCMALSMFSKEQGATCLMAVVSMDLVERFGSLSGFAWQLLKELRQRGQKKRKNSEKQGKDSEESSTPTTNGTEAANNDSGGDVTEDDAEVAQAIPFVGRAAVLGLQTLGVCLARMTINGETRPDFISDQNPAGFAPERFTRIFSINWVYCLYLWDYAWPANLCPDWSGRSIDLIQSAADPRAVAVLLLWAFIGWCIYQFLFLDLTKKHVDSTKETQGLTTRQKQQVLIAFWSFVACPFLLSSNLLVVVGLMKADRVIYLPLAGLCMLEAWLHEFLQSHNGVSARAKSVLHLALLLQLGALCAKTHERNVAWSTSELLWQEAYRVNPRSYHTMYNYGYELSLRKKYARAEHVLRPIADPHVNGPSNTFVYAMVLQNLNRCDEANRLMDRALALAERQQKEAAEEAELAAASAPGANESSSSSSSAASDAAAALGRNVRNTESSYARVKSNLLVARSFCSQDAGLAGKHMYDAVQADPTNEYAVEQAKAMLSHYERLQQQQKLVSDLLSKQHQVDQ